MKKPGRRDVTPKRKPGFRIQPSVGKQGMTIEQPFSSPAIKETLSPADEAPPTEVADLITSSAEPEASAHEEPATVAAVQADTEERESAFEVPTAFRTDPEEFFPLTAVDQVEAVSPVEVPAEPLVEQHEPGTLDYQQPAGDLELGSAPEVEQTAYYEANGTDESVGAEYQTAAITDEYGTVDAEYQDATGTGSYPEPGTPEYDAYYAAGPATEEFPSSPYVYDPATTEQEPYDYATELFVDSASPPHAFYQTGYETAPEALASSDAPQAPDSNLLTLPDGTEPKSAPGLRSLAPISTVFQPRFASAGAVQPKSGFSFWSLALASLVFLSLGAAAGYFFANSIGGAVNPALAASPADRSTTAVQLVDSVGLKSGEQEAVDAAFAANKAGDFAGAIRMFTDLQAKHPEWVSMGTEIGRSQLYQRDLSGAGATFKDALSRNRAPSDANFLLGLLFMTNNAFSDAEASFAKAVALDPARPDFYYFWGECLRREGKPLEAIGKFRAALLRNQYETAEGLYRLKWWLSDIQADQEKTDGTSTQIDVALTQARPPMEALFAAAVRSLKAGQITEAAASLGRARQVVEPSVFFVIMQDPSLTQESWRPELAEFFKAGAPAAANPAAPTAAKGK